jgi:hypothetical protein
MAVAASFVPLRHRRAAREATSVRDQVLDLRSAIAELEKAEREMTSVPEGLPKYEREKRMLEPMARVSLAERFLADMLKRNGWGRE